MIRVRSIARILRGEELTISYVDPAKPYSDLRAKLSAKYLFDCGDADLRWTAGDDDPRRTAAIAAAYGVQGPTSEPAAVVGKAPRRDLAGRCAGAAREAAGADGARSRGGRRTQWQQWDWAPAAAAG